jgi:hypothetical protein
MNPYRNSEDSSEVKCAFNCMNGDYEGGLLSISFSVKELLIIVEINKSDIIGMACMTGIKLITIFNGNNTLKITKNDPSLPSLFKIEKQLFNLIGNIWQMELLISSLNGFVLERGIIEE